MDTVPPANPPVADKRPALWPSYLVAVLSVGLLVGSGLLLLGARVAAGAEPFRDLWEALVLQLIVLAFGFGLGAFIPVVLGVAWLCSTPRDQWRRGLHEGAIFAMNMTLLTLPIGVAILCLAIGAVALSLNLPSVNWFVTAPNLAWAETLGPSGFFLLSVLIGVGLYAVLFRMYRPRVDALARELEMLCLRCGYEVPMYQPRCPECGTERDITWQGPGLPGDDRPLV